MAETELQIEKQRVSELRQHVLKQHAIVLGLKRQGGQRLEDALTEWESLYPSAEGRLVWC